MPATRRFILHLSLLCLLSSLLMGCSALPTISFNGTPVTHSQDTPDGEQQLDVWQAISPGIELRYERWTGPSTNSDIMVIVRFNPAKIHLSVDYQPDQPLSMSEWTKQTNAKVLINGGYFDNHNRATGLLVSNGDVYGQSYDAFGGMLSVNSEGKIGLRALHEQPYDPTTEQLQQATQSTPMLIEHGKRTEFNANGATERRTIVAQDKQGRLLFIISPGLTFSLDEMADVLEASDLSIQTALNLDGGASTGIYVRDSNNKNRVTIDSVTAIPIVIAVK
ncbi:phosphodiester glycosidase family protein [Ktedonospora formicarum]|uniref:Phosphodiester glycosidase domain-containing protein n=1 Tax=Ktedonospora formicarum TaxID=2778364 RepID=A0A8J3MR31_9CHLR|nr:phosphodiester glycosidase family protein [Ktedonospora formicarum]GHO43243.1 hypothetical protein KSX_14060 [Ktedonospora formicarum]